MDSIDKLQIVANKYQPGIAIADCGKYYSLGSFPEKLMQPIKDYIDTHFEVISSDNCSVQFIDG